MFCLQYSKKKTLLRITSQTPLICHGDSIITELSAHPSYMTPERINARNKQNTSPNPTGKHMLNPNGCLRHCSSTCTTSWIWFVIADLKINDRGNLMMHIKRITLYLRAQIAQFVPLPAACRVPRLTKCEVTESNQTYMYAQSVLVLDLGWHVPVLKGAIRLQSCSKCHIQSLFTHQPVTVHTLQPVPAFLLQPETLCYQTRLQREGKVLW